ncbi:MAG: nucleotidyltransferase family protein [Nitrospirae bacterium]|nr:nucleotidyltransferase family protein [Nitrospirota bacterium]
MEGRVSAVLLAAGSSKRMGQLKQLLPLKGKPIIRHSLDALLSAGLDDIVVVLGERNPDLINIVGGLPVRVVFNTVPGSDMAESLRTGLRSVDCSSTGILISLADHPMASSATIQVLVSLHHQKPDRILVPRYEMRKGHPVLLPSILLKDIHKGGTLRDVIGKYPERIRPVEVEDRGVVLDIDTMEDYENLLNLAPHESKPGPARPSGLSFQRSARKDILP